jgi:hypothetical protein
MQDQKSIKKHNRSKEIPKGICGYITVLGEEGEGNLFLQISLEEFSLEISFLWKFVGCEFVVVRVLVCMLG